MQACSRKRNDSLLFSTLCGVHMQGRSRYFTLRDVQRLYLQYCLLFRGTQGNQPNIPTEANMDSPLVSFNELVTQE